MNMNGAGSVIKGLAVRLLEQEEYKMQCVDYLENVSDDLKSIVLEFPIFNLVFLLLYLIILTTQVLCMLKHRYIADKVSRQFYVY